ncbi:polyphosphate kinase 2 family protein [Alsobacter sp. SYSU M60028]|uniref:Polyphosphate kinase 2 family protein n=1 Tax=Alsobacter ponti TaxID=2962936 RepID=A0ABT1LK73_9HYPH|nr:polyphosphate kinase 2 family protein [Alsobacter ponti]
MGDPYRVKPGQKVKLSDIDPRDTDALGSEDEARGRLYLDATAIDTLQDRLYAEGKRSLLVILQGMDTSGKDGTVRGVFNTTGPLGVQVTAFRRPSEEEMAHDFLWRAHLAAPRRGTIGIFNRSHYEDVLVVKVRKLVPASDIEKRYDQINAFEKMLTENGVTILKFMLHISKAEQRERLQERLDDPKKHWKFNPGDLDDRKSWGDFMDAYETMLHRCSTEWAPWRIVPADRKWARNAVIADVVRKTLEDMNPTYPKVSWDPKSIKIV